MKDKSFVNNPLTGAIREPDLNNVNYSQRPIILEVYNVSYIDSKSSLQWLTPSLTRLKHKGL